MQNEAARLLVIGVGVNGALCARALHTAGCDVTLLARGARYEAIRDRGVVIEDPMTNQRSVIRVPVIDVLAPDDMYDYILVVVRKNQVAALLPTLARNRSPNIVFMGNNTSGPGEYTAVLGRERVMLGFVFGAGRREGDVIRAWAPKGIARAVLATPFGELDGTVTPRLSRLVDILRRAGLNAHVSNNISDYLTTHAAEVALVGRVIVQHDCDTYALARSRVDLTLLIDGLREVLDVLHITGHAIVPRSSSLIRYIPRSVLVAGCRALFASRFGEVGAGWHCSQAPDEMQQLANELDSLVKKSGLPVPAIRKILAMGKPTKIAS